MSEYKYIVFQTEDREIPIIFPKDISHKNMFNAVVSRQLVEDMMYEPISAGFITFIPSVKCYGNSESLFVESRGDVDTNLVKNYPYSCGFKFEKDS